MGKIVEQMEDEETRRTGKIRCCRCCGGPGCKCPARCCPGKTGCAKTCKTPPREDEDLEDDGGSSSGCCGSSRSEKRRQEEIEDINIRKEAQKLQLEAIGKENNLAKEKVEELAKTQRALARSKVDFEKATKQVALVNQDIDTAELAGEILKSGGGAGGETGITGAFLQKH